MRIVKKLDLNALDKGQIHHFWLELVTDGVGLPIYIPVIAARGRREGPTLGMTAAVHGNELNGIPVIQRLFKELDVDTFGGTLVGVPVVNVPSLLRHKRRFFDETDLNHIMPGKKDGNVSEVYAYRFVDKLVRQFDYLVDLHTASFGRVNSYYIRADMEDPVVRRMALLQNAQIIVHNPPSDGTLRGAAAELGIHAITLEVGNPNTFQRGLIRSGLTGIYNLLCHLNMIDGKIEDYESPPVICGHSFWIYTDTGGILTVHPGETDMVEKGQLIASMRDVFGSPKKEYHAPQDGVVIGKSVSPVNYTGGRILHLGVVTDNDFSKSDKSLSE